jgi:hypothetical protein
VNGRRPRVTLEQYQRIRQVWAARRAIPGDKELARELDLPAATIRTAMVRGLKTYENQLRAKHGRKPKA